jgi:hypothetical protein
MNIKQSLILSTSVVAGLLGVTGIASADQVTVKSGDTLSSLAVEHNTNIDALQALNNIADINLIYVGEQLEIDGTVAPAVQPEAVNPPVQEVAPVIEQPVQQVQYTAPTPVVTQVAAPQAQVTAPVTQTAAPVNSGSTYDQFIANGGSAALWSTIVMPESGGNPNVVSSAGYRGLGQTKESWGTGSVATQTKGMLNYANSRYGSVENAISFRQANGWW